MRPGMQEVVLAGNKHTPSNQVLSAATIQQAGKGVKPGMLARYGASASLYQKPTLVFLFTCRTCLLPALHC